jgi:hypothetical protein
MDSLKAIYEDIEEYKDLCRKYNEKIRYTSDYYGNNIPDCYGKHANKLKKRNRQE